MKICEKYDHLSALNILQSKDSIYHDVCEILKDPTLVFGRSDVREIKKTITAKFNRNGWGDRIRVSRTSKLTISFMKNRVGICFQLGNVARTYADILKLDLLGSRNIIDVGIIIVPYQYESKLLGANYARYDRLVNEMMDFEELIDTPILVLALSN